MRAVYLKSVKSPVVQKGFVFRPPAKQMNHSDIYSQAVVEQDSNYEMDSFCVDSDEALDESTWNEPSVVQPETRTRRAQVKPALGKKERPNIATNGRRRKRIIFEDSSSDENDAAPPPKKTAKPSEDSVGVAPKEPAKPFVFQQSRSNPSATKSGSVTGHPVKQEDGKTNFCRPAGTTVPATDRIVLPPSNGPMFPSNNNGTSVSNTRTKPVTERATVLPSSNSSIASSSSSVSEISNQATLSPARTMLISSRQVATTTQVISSLQVKHRCATHVGSFEVADFVLSCQLGVIRKLHSGEFERERASIGLEEVAICDTGS